MSLLIKLVSALAAFSIVFVFFWYFDIFNPLMFFPDQCVFSGNAIKCVSHSMDEGRIKLLLMNQAGDIVIQDIVATSEVLMTGACSISDSERNVRLNTGKKRFFILNKSADDSTCAYNGSVDRKIRYDVKIKYNKVGVSPINRTIDGKLII